MTIFFDFNKVKKAANNLPKNILYILNKHYVQNLGIYTGSSFILNYGDLSEDKSDILYKIQYIDLASRRNYSLYKRFTLKTLDLSLYPDLNYKTINRNPLLSISGNEMHFLYEEPLRKKKWH